MCGNYHSSGRKNVVIPFVAFVLEKCYMNKLCLLTETSVRIMGLLRCNPAKVLGDFLQCALALRPSSLPAYQP